MKREFPFPIPNGWFLLAVSDELRVGDVRPLHYFGRELVLFRTESGQARVFDAYCPHLGAHLGHGGKVVGDSLRCPFHAWRFDGDGTCVEVPYAKRIPPRACVNSYPVVESRGNIMVWYHGAGEAPTWTLPDVPELESEEWTTPVRREWIVRSRNQELAENSVDQAHFRYVHGTNTVASSEVKIEGNVFHVICKAEVDTSKGEADGVIDIRAHGFGFGVTRFTGVVETLVVTSGCPIDDERVHMRLQLTLRKLPDSDMTTGVGSAFVSEIERQFEQDIPIWENKIHHDRPVLCDGDGPIGQLRQWAQQFYTLE